MNAHIRIPDELVRAIAREVVVLLLAETRALSQAPSPWLSVDEAADYLRASKQRVYDLVSEGKLKPARDGRRLLFGRADLDAYLLGQEEAA